MRTTRNTKKDDSGPLPFFLSISEETSSHSESQVSIQYQVQQILDHRPKPKSDETNRAVQTLSQQRSLQDLSENSLEYLVKWRGEAQATWQPGSNLKNAPEIVQSYKKNNCTHSQMKKSKGMTTARSKTKKTLNGQPDKRRGRPSKPFDFKQVYPHTDDVKFSEDEDFGIIDKEVYLQSLREDSDSSYFERLHKETRENNKLGQGRRKQKIAVPNISQNNKQAIFQIQKKKPLLSQKQKTQRRRLDIPVHQQRVVSLGSRASQSKVNTSRVKQRNIGYSQQSNKIKEKQRLNEQSQRKQLQIQEVSSEEDPFVELLANKTSKTTTKNQPEKNTKKTDFVVALKNKQPALEEFPHFSPQAQVPQLDLICSQSEIKQTERKSDSDKHKHKPSPKRSLVYTEQINMAQSLSKKIKENQSLLDDFKKQKQPIQTINLDQDCLENSLNLPYQQEMNYPSKQNKSLQKKIHNQITELLGQGTNLFQFDSRVQQRLEHNHFQKHRPDSTCSVCARHQSHNTLLNDLFSDLIKSSLNLDTLFLEQETLSVLSTLNPNFSSVQHRFNRFDKMVDLSENRAMCNLITKRQPRLSQIDSILQDYTLQKLVKIDGQWYGICKLRERQQGRDHFKFIPVYMMADHQNLLVQFLTQRS